jgi:hypothetical protein
MSALAESLILSPQQLQPLALSLARRIARNPDDVDDLMQEGLFAYHRARRLRSAAYLETAPNPWAMARRIMRCAMLRVAYARTPPAGTTLVSLDATPEDGGAPAWASDGGAAVGRQSDLLALEEFFAALERRHGALARRVAENLVEPRDPECCRRLLAAAERKRRLRARRVRLGTEGPLPRVRMSPRAVREALGVAEPQWRQTLTQVRAFTRDWVAAAVSGRGGTVSW